MIDFFSAPRRSSTRSSRSTCPARTVGTSTCRSWAVDGSWFSSRDAGIGRRVARLHGASPETATGYTREVPPEGREFTEEHPRLHYEWKSTQEYRQRFGYLDYMHEFEPGQPYGRDAGAPVQLPREVAERCSFVPYPYVSGRFAEAVLWDVHAEALERLLAGEPHPAREAVLVLARLAEEHDAAWGNLTEDETDWVLSRKFGREQAMLAEPSAVVLAKPDLRHDRSRPLWDGTTAVPRVCQRRPPGASRGVFTFLRVTVAWSAPRRTFSRADWI